MNFYALLPLAAIITNLAIGFYIAYRGLKPSLNKFYMLVVIGILVWSLSDFMTFTATSTGTALPWIRLGTTGSTLAVTSLAVFILTFVKHKSMMKKRNILFLYIPAVILSSLSALTNLSVREVQHVYWGYENVRGILNIPISFYLIVLTIYMLKICYNFYRNTSTPREKSQARLIILGVTIPLAGGSVTELIFPVLDILIIPLTSALTTGTAIFIAYAMTKYGMLKQSSHSIQKKILSTLFIIIIIVSMAMLTTSYVLSRSTLQEQAEEKLVSTAFQKANHANNYISERKGDILALATSPTLTNILDKRTGIETDLAKADIKQTAEKVAKEVEDYIKSHPNMTVKDLQNDPAFQAVAVQPVGMTGYTAIADYDSLVILFHKSPNKVGINFHDLKDKLPEVYEIRLQSIGGKEASGFYDWEESDGTIRKKYVHITPVKTRTADDSGLSIASTTYTNEYETTLKIEKESEDYLVNFMETYSYQNLFLADEHGNIWWSGKEKDQIRINVNREGICEKGLSEIYEKVKETQQTEFSDFERCGGENKIVFFVGRPVYENNEMIGAIILQIDVEQISAIMQDPTGLGKTGETYIVGQDGLMRSKSRFSEDTILKQHVDTLNSRICINHVAKHVKDGKVKEHEEPVVIEKNYRGISTFGAHSYLLEKKWCILAEIEETEVFEPSNEMIRFMVTIFFGLLILGFGVSTVTARSISRPITELRDITKEISRGKLDTKIRVRTGDETGELAEAFSQMTKDLKKSQDEIKKHTMGLESKVKQRTRELDSKVKDLMDIKTALMNMMEDYEGVNKDLMGTQETLKGNVEELKRTDIKKNEFMSIAAHELKTPLTSIHGFSQLLQNENIAKDPVKRNKYLTIIDHETERLANLVNNVLELSRVDLMAIKFDIVSVDLEKTINTVKTELDVQMKNKGLESEYIIEKGLPAIMTDQERFTQILINLINNSIKYTQKGKITVKAFKENEFIHFVVKDTGIGIAKKDQSKIFSRFFQADSSYTRSAGGVGLGLSLTKEFVQLLGGKIWFISDAGKGTEFHFTLPIKGATKTPRNPKNTRPAKK